MHLLPVDSNGDRGKLLLNWNPLGATPSRRVEFTHMRELERFSPRVDLGLLTIDYLKNALELHCPGKGEVITVCYA